MNLDTPTLILACFAATLTLVVWMAHRMGSDRRDVALLGAAGGLCGVGAAVALII